MVPPGAGSSTAPVEGRGAGVVVVAGAVVAAGAVVVVVATVRVAVVCAGADGACLRWRLGRFP